MDAEEATTLYTQSGKEPKTPVQTPGGRHCPVCGLSVPLTVSACPKDGTTIDDTLGEGRKLVGNYEFLEFIGSGGMGVIYKARHPVLKRLVAIKMLHSHLMSDVITRRFQQEAEAVSGLSHRCIIAVHDYGVSEHGQPYMVMDFVDGKPLSEVLRMGLLPIEAVINIGIQLSEGLNHAHEHGVLHRDLKPSNIMVSDYDCAFPLVKVVDFGIAKIMEADATKVTQTGELIGTPQYMSPEQCSGGELDARSDIYSVGCVLFEALTGKPPFAGESMVAIIVDQISKPARALSEVRPDLVFPNQLEDLISKALSKDPADRQQSMRDLVVELIEVGKLVCQPENEKSKFFKGFRLNKEQRNLLWISLASGLSLLAVASSTIMFTDIASQSRRKDKAKQAKTIGSEIDKAVIDERSSVTRFLDPRRLDDHFVRNYFVVDLGIRYLELSNSLATDMSMVAVAKQTELRYLGLDFVPLSDAGAAYLRPLQRLLELRLKATRITDKSMEYVGSLSTLQTLSLANDNITDAGVEKLKGLKLKLLDLSGTGISDGAFKTIGSMDTLQGLIVSDCSQIKGEGFAHLRQLPALKALEARGLKLSDAAFAAIGQIRPLFHLIISQGNYTAAGIDSLKHLDELVCLNISATNFDASWIPLLAKMPKLTELELNSTAINGETLASLARQMPNITKLYLANTRLKDADIACLAGLKKLVYVDLRQTPVTARGVDQLYRAKVTPGNDFKILR